MVSTEVKLWFLIPWNISDQIHRILCPKLLYFLRKCTIFKTKAQRCSCTIPSQLILYSELYTSKLTTFFKWLLVIQMSRTVIICAHLLQFGTKLGLTQYLAHFIILKNVLMLVHFEFVCLFFKWWGPFFCNKFTLKMQGSVVYSSCVILDGISNTHEITVDMRDICTGTIYFPSSHMDTV